MIYTKEEMREYIEEDRKAYGKPEKYTFKQWLAAKLFPDYNWEYMKCLRKLEFYQNARSTLRFYYVKKLSRLKYLKRIDLEPNCAGPGLHISHGNIVVSSQARIGKNCKILQGVTIGGHGRYDKTGAPVVGDRVFIGAGAKIIGTVRIADDVVIGANAVVVKDVLEPGITVAGIPARKVSDHGSYHYLNRT